MALRDHFNITIGEVLLFGGIVAIVLLISGLAVTSARGRARDYRRLSDISRIQAALELYLNDTNAYPVTEGLVALGDNGALCLSADGLQPTCSSTGRRYLFPIPTQMTQGIGGEVPVYAYQGNADTYSIAYAIEGNLPRQEINKGVICAYPGQLAVLSRGGECPLR